MLLKKLISHDFRHTAINQIWRLISGPAMLLIIPIYLSAQAQGYWFTFISLAALAVFADLGFTTIILQFSAHEFAHLHFDENKKLVGNKEYLDRIGSLFRFSLRWSIQASFIAFPLILLVGYLVLSQKQVNIQWFIPWVIYTIASVFVFVNNVVLSFIEGCDSVGDVQKIRFIISVANFIIIIIGLIGHFELYALAIGLIGSTLSGTIVVIKRYGAMLKQLYSIEATDRHNWKKDILPLLGRYAISWASGYFIFSIFTPLAFHYYGAIEAGKVGLSSALWMAIFGISNIWMTIIMPKINMFVSKGDYASLDPIFYKHLVLSVFTFLLGMGTVFSIYFFIDGKYEIVNRFMSPTAMLIIALGWLMQSVVSSLAVYMRAHKVEPLVIPSLITGIYIGVTTWLIAIYFPFEYFFIGFLSSYVWGIPWVLWIFKKHKGGKIASK